VKKVNCLHEENEIREKWVQYVEELYQDNNQDDKELQCHQHESTITHEEVRSIVKSSPIKKLVEWTIFLLNLYRTWVICIRAPSVAAVVFTCTLFFLVFSTVYEWGYIPHSVTLSPLRGTYQTSVHSIRVIWAWLNSLIKTNAVRA
jgi:Fe2+ transport system protein B